MSPRFTSYLAMGDSLLLHEFFIKRQKYLQCFAVFLDFKISALFSHMSESNRVPPDLTYSLQ